MIDLDNITDNAVERVFSLLPTAVGVGTYYKSVSGHGSGDYDPVTDTVLQPLDVRNNVRMMRVAVTAEELAGSPVTVEDAKFLIPGRDLNGLECGTEDYLDYRGRRYDVIKVRPLPTDAIRILYGRAK